VVHGHGSGLDTYRHGIMGWIHTDRCGCGLLTHNCVSGLWCTGMVVGWIHTDRYGSGLDTYRYGSELSVGMSWKRKLTCIHSLKEKYKFLAVRH
jgi:hypothetical protein